MKFASRLDDVQLSMIRQIMSRASGCVNLGIGEPDYLAPSAVREEASRVSIEEKLPYTPNAGLPGLCEAVKQYHKLGEDHAVCVCNGSQEALFDAFFALIDPGDEVLVPNPGFVAYPTIVRLAGGIPVPYRLSGSKEFQLDREDLERKITRRTKAILLNSPSNPTGRCLSRSDLEFVATVGERHGCFLLSDEIYREIYFGDSRPASLLEVCSEAIVFSGVSKMASMTGWRIGWACGPKAVIDKVTVMHQYTSSCASTLSQKAVLALFTDEGRAGIAQLRETLRENGRVAMDRIDTVMRRRYIPPEGAFYLMLDIRDRSHDSLGFALELLKDGVAVIPGAAFGTEGEGYLRISFAGQKQALVEGLTRLAASKLFA